MRWLFCLLSTSSTTARGGGWVTGILLAIGGACLVVWLWKKLVK